jgi:transcriptional regulator with XRE-family HTH domain
MIELAELGRRIRTLRLERRQTLKQVEEASGLSSTHLSEIERGRTSPTVGALVRIARALERDASYFIEPDERAEVAYTARERRRPLAGRPQAESLSSGIPGSRLFPYRVLLAPEQRPPLQVDAQPLPGDAVYVVRMGEVLAEVGDASHVLSEGDVLHASLSNAHRLRARGGRPAEVLCLLTHPLE